MSQGQQQHEQQQQTAIFQSGILKQIMSKHATVTTAARVILMAFRPMVFAKLLFCFQLESATMPILSLMV